MLAENLGEPALKMVLLYLISFFQSIDDELIYGKDRQLSWSNKPKDTSFLLLPGISRLLRISKNALHLIAPVVIPEKVFIVCVSYGFPVLFGCKCLAKLCETFLKLCKTL